MFALSGWEKLVDVNICRLGLIKEVLLEVKVIRKSLLHVPGYHSTKATDRLIEMTRAVGGNKCVSGPCRVADLDRGKFRDTALEFVDPPRGSYRKECGRFVPDLSVADALFNSGDKTINRLLT